MLDLVSDNLRQMFDGLPQMVLYGLVFVLLALAGLLSVKIFWRLRGNTAHTSFQYGVVAPVQYGDRGSEAPEEMFARRLENMVEEEESYELAKLMPKARELGAIAKTSFHTAPVINEDDADVLGLIEQVVQELNCGFRVLVQARLGSMIDLEGQGVQALATKLSMTGVDLKFAVVDRFGKLIVAVDHLGNTPLGRQDNINRTVTIEVLRKAGVWYLEIPQNYSVENAKAQLLAVLRGKAANQSGGEEVA